MNFFKGKSVLNSKENTWIFSDLRNYLIVISTLNIFIKIFSYLCVFS